MWDSHWRHHPHGCVLGCTAGSPFDLAIFSFFWGIFGGSYGLFCWRFSGSSWILWYVNGCDEIFCWIFLAWFSWFCSSSQGFILKNTLWPSRASVYFLLSTITLLSNQRFRNAPSPRTKAELLATWTHALPDRTSSWAKKTGEISWNTMIVIWTIEFTNGSFTKMELYGSKIRVGSVRKWGLPPNNHFNRENDDQPPMDLCCCFHILRQSHIFWFQARKSSNRLAAGEWFINPHGARLRSGLSRHIPTTYYLS